MSIPAGSRGGELVDTLGDLPPEALVPVAWIREQLRELTESDAARTSLLTVNEVAARCRRAPSTVRAWCASGSLPGAFKLNGVSWRVPESALRAFIERQTETERPRRALGRGTPVDIGGWRKHRVG